MVVFRALIVLLVLNAVSFSSQQSAEELEIADNSVYVQFDKNEGDLLELEEWDENRATGKFKDITADVATVYCQNMTEGCNLVDLNTGFAPGDVMLVEEREFWNGDIRLKVYISLSGKNVIDETITVMPKIQLIDIIKMGQTPYMEGLTDPELEGDYNITLMFVDDVRVAAPMDFSTNIIMIAVSFLILLSALMLAVVLKCKESMEEKKMLEGLHGGGSTNVPTDDGENLTLTAMKPAEDGKGSEGPVKV